LGFRGKQPANSLTTWISQTKYVCKTIINADPDKNNPSNSSRPSLEARKFIVCLCDFLGTECYQQSECRDRQPCSNAIQRRENNRRFIADCDRNEAAEEQCRRDGTE
jgi:hypothetical protein